MLSSRRIQAVQAPIIPTVAEWIRQTPGTISLGQGVVYYGPPPQAIERIAAFLAGGDNHKYKPVHGIPELLERLATKLREENGIAATSGDARKIVVSAGGNMAFLNALLAIGDPGDEFILLRPAYFNHEMAVVMANCRAVLVDTDAAYQPDFDAIRRAITPRTRAIVTVSPNNPTGAVYGEALLRAINGLCREKEIYHIHDEAYEYFTYGSARHFSPCSIAGSEAYTLGLFSMSKSFGMASWRIGYGVISTHLFDPIRKIQDANLICPPVISQHAALGALEAGRGWCLEKRREIEVMRQMLRETLGAIPDLCAVPPTDGAFYFLARVNSALPALKFAERLVREHRVAVIPGEAFGIQSGCHLRIGYGALPREQAAEGFARLAAGIAAICSGESA